MTLAQVEKKTEALCEKAANEPGGRVLVGGKGFAPVSATLFRDLVAVVRAQQKEIDELRAALSKQ